MITASSTGITPAGIRIMMLVFNILRHNPGRFHHCRHCLSFFSGAGWSANPAATRSGTPSDSSNTEQQSAQSSDQSWRLESYVSSVADGCQPGISFPSGQRWQQQLLYRLVGDLPVKGVARQGLRGELTQYTVLHSLFPLLEKLGVVSTGKFISLIKLSQIFILKHTSKITFHCYFITTVSIKACIKQLI